MGVIDKLNIARTVIFLIFSLSFNIYALKFSPKLGVTYSNVSMNEDAHQTPQFPSPEYKLGKIFSLELQVNIGGDFNFNSGLIFNQKGFVKVYKNNETEDIDVYSVEVPFLISYKIIKYLDVYLGFYLGGSSYMELDKGVTIGTVLNIKNFLIDFRFNQGSGYVIKRLIENEMGVYFENNRQFIVMIGYQFF